jgi:hypothetical protein
LGELAELFELMHGAPESFRTLRAVIRDSIDHEPVRRRHAQQLEEADAEGWAAYLAEGGGPDCEPCWSDSDHTTSLWIQQPDLLREESLTRTWEPLRVETNAGPTHSLYSNLLDPLALVPFVHLEPDGEETVAGRDGVCLRALPRQLDRLASTLSWLSNADEGELVVDRERGILLRMTTALESDPVQVAEMTELELDLPLDAELFIPSPPAEVEPSTRVGVTAGLVTVEQAAAQVPFTVFVPPVIWPRARLNVTLMGEVWLGYSDFEGVQSGSAARDLSIRQSAHPHETWVPDEPVRVDLDGIEGLAWVGAASLTDGKVSFPRFLRFVRGGTHLEFHSQGRVEREELMGLARSLVPVRSESPRLG